MLAPSIVQPLVVQFCHTTLITSVPVPWKVSSSLEGPRLMVSCAKAMDANIAPATNANSAEQTSFVFMRVPLGANSTHVSGVAISGPSGIVVRGVSVLKQE